MLNNVFTDYFKKKSKICGSSARIDGTLHIIHDYLSKEDIKAYLSYARILVQDDVNDIKTLLSSRGSKVTEKTFQKFCNKRLVSSLDRSPYLTIQIEVQVKVGWPIKTTKECYLAITIDDNLIVFDRTIDNTNNNNKHQPKEILKSKEIIKLGKLNSFQI